MKELGLDHQSSECQPSPFSISLLSLTNLGCLSLIVLQASSYLEGFSQSNSSFKAQVYLVTPWNHSWQPWFRGLSLGWLVVSAVFMTYLTQAAVLSPKSTFYHTPAEHPLSCRSSHWWWWAWQCCRFLMLCDGDSHSGSYKPHLTFLILPVYIISLSCIPAFICPMSWVLGSGRYNDYFQNVCYIR